MTAEELKSVSAMLDELNGRMTRMEKRVAELKKNFEDTDEATSLQLFGPDEGDEVLGFTLHERVESLEKLLANGEVTIRVGGRTP